MQTYVFLFLKELPEYYIKQWAEEMKNNIVCCTVS